MPAHHRAPGGAKRPDAPVDLCSVRRGARRRQILALLSELGPLMLQVSRAADSSPCDACEALAEARDLIAATLSSCHRDT